jgi:c-di-GMP-related signal transduction protein
MLLGPEEVRKWLLMVCSVAGEAKPRQKAALSAALVRAKFVELIARDLQLVTAEAFTLGLLSSFHSILGLPATAIVNDVALSEDVRAALVGAMNPLRGCLEMALAYEKADWQTCEQMRKHCPVPSHSLSRAYKEATHWADQISQEANPNRSYRAPGMPATRIPTTTAPLPLHPTTLVR